MKINTTNQYAKSIRNIRKVNTIRTIKTNTNTNKTIRKVNTKITKTKQQHEQSILQESKSNTKINTTNKRMKINKNSHTTNQN